jgi:hypothetical protein
MRNHRCARVQEQQGRAEELRQGQKLFEKLAEPLANPASLVSASQLRLERQHHCRESLPCALHLYSSFLPHLAKDFRC